MATERGPPDAAAITAIIGSASRAGVWNVSAFARLNGIRKHATPHAAWPAASTSRSRQCCVGAPGMSMPVEVVKAAVSHSAPASLSATARSSLSGVPSLKMAPEFVPPLGDRHAGRLFEAARLRSSGFWLEAEGELCLFAHELRRPRRGEHHLGEHPLYLGHLTHELLHLLGDLRADRAARRGEREGDVDVAALHLDVVDQAELDEVETQLGVDHVGESVLYVFHGRHGVHVSSLRSVPIVLLIGLFIAVPIAEIYVIIQVGEAIGAIPTILILVADSVIGSMLWRSQGRRAWARFRQTVERGVMPHREVIDGVLVIFGGAFLITPGFISDVVGFLLLLPPTRAVIRRLLIRRL